MKVSISIGSFINFVLVRNFEPKGTFAQEKFEIDISVCFFEETGRSASEKIKVNNYHPNSSYSFVGETKSKW